MKPLKHIEKLSGYVPGKQPKGDDWVKLNTNENPYPPSPKVLDAIREKLAGDGAGLRRYPDPRSEVLRSKLATYHGLCANQLIIGNGSDDVLNLLVRAYCSESSPAAMMLPSYSLYPVLVAIAGGQLLQIPFDESICLDVSSILAAEYNVLFLTSPNAPTGVAFPEADIRSILEKKDALIVVDEAYGAFAESTAIPLLSEYPNLVVTRTFSKSHSLAALRVGYAMAHPSVIERLDAVRDSYNVDALAQAGAIAAIEDDAYYKDITQKVINSRERIQHFFKNLAWFAYPSQANFVFVRPQSRGGETSEPIAASLFDFLMEQKILVRHFPDHQLTSAYLRISIGTDSEMDRLEEAIRAWIDQQA